MASDLLAIAASGARAAQAALDVTSQNIANAGTAGYIRRSVDLAEVASADGSGQVGGLSLSGVRVAGVSRNADAFRQAEVRRTGSDAARASAELTGLQNTESALSNPSIFDAMTNFEVGLQGLVANPTDSSQRATVLENARTLSNTFNIAAQSLAQVGTGLQSEASDAVTSVNLAAQNLAQVNLQISRTAPGSSDQATLLDQRDGLLKTISANADVTTTIAADQTVSVQLGGAGGPALVSGGTASPLAMAVAADGTLSFSVGASAVALAGGALAGKAQAASALKTTMSTLDGIAASLITTANTAQAAGVALDGTAGQPLFSGTSAATIGIALTSGAGLATAPAGAAAGSQDPANLQALRTALNTNKISDNIDALMFATSSAVAGRKTTSDALGTIATSAQTALDAQSGVNLDDEAVSLVKYQQAFQASSKAIQVAATLFDTLFALH